MMFIDWWAGIGGFRVGLERSGHECVASCEIAKFPRKVYAHHFGHEPTWRDINEVRPEEIPQADLWCGGFPCQDVSSAGPRTGLAGERSGLVFVLLRLAAVVRPRWLYLENVDELLVRGSGFDALLGALDEIGYVGAWRVLDAQHFALAQHRERVFVLARDSRAPGGCPAGVLAESSCMRGDRAPRGAARPQAAGASAVRPRGRRGEHAAFAVAPERGQGADLVAHAVDLSPALTATDGRSERGVRVVAFDPAQVTHPENRSRCPEGGPAPSLTATGRPHVATWRIPSNGANELPRESDVARTLDSNGGWGWAAGGTLVSDDPSATLTTGRLHVESTIVAQMVAHDPAAAALTCRAGEQHTAESNYVMVGARVRKLTPRECERLQGFDDDWTKIPGAKPTARYEAIGNSVAVPVVEFVGRRLADAEDA